MVRRRRRCSSPEREPMVQEQRWRAGRARSSSWRVVRIATGAPAEEKVARRTHAPNFTSVQAEVAFFLILQAVAVAWSTPETGRCRLLPLVGPVLATRGANMKLVSKRCSEPTRESSLIRSRLVAAAGSLLKNWTDFGRLIT